MRGDDERLIAFLAGIGRDAAGRTHAEILGWSDARLEAVHDYIQWLFPLPEMSGANPSAPRMTAPVRAALAGSPQLQAGMQTAWLRMLSFYGLEAQAGTVRRAPNFPERAKNWLTPGNHNHLRLTRILRSLHLAGLPEQSAATFQALEEIYREEQRKPRPGITATTYAFWRRAGEEPT